LLTIDVIGVFSESMPAFKVELSELQLPWLRIKVYDDLAGWQGRIQGAPKKKLLQKRNC
jgi:hypothetical protein